MKSNTSIDNSDISFVGSGISTAFTLLHFLNAIENRRPAKKLDIKVIDKYPEFNTGIPYGSRSGFSVLLITSLRNFLPEPELSEFIPWLNANKNWLLKEFEKEGGTLSKDWLSLNAVQIENNDWEDLFIPRRFFGCYINEKVTKTIGALQKKGILEVTFIHSKVVAIEKNINNWMISLENKTKIASENVVLAVGSLPTAYLWEKKSFIAKKNLLFINNPYKDELDATLSKIDAFLKQRALMETNVAIIGANASALELLYKLNDASDTESHINKFTFISTQGILPDSDIDYEKLRQYTPVHLKALRNVASLKAETVAEAAFKDLEDASNLDLGAASTVGIVSSAFGSLLGKLNEEELEKFACYYGNEIGRKQRCAGAHYSNTVSGLKKNNRFDHIAGRFNTMKPNDNEFYLEYQDTETKQNKMLDYPVHIVINCVGSMNLNMPNLPDLLKNLVNKGYVASNPSNIGFKVNENLEASDHFYVVGPLLAGNVIEGKAVWHVEHCGRIIWLSELLGNILAKKYVVRTFDTKKTFQFEVIDLQSESQQKKYTATVKEKWDGNPYYLYDYFAHHKSDTDHLFAFELKNEGESLVIMPIVKRMIPHSNEEFYDAVSPYGYSGPLFKEGLEASDIDFFWQKVDEWYKQNNVITEFVRFSLNDNHQNYSGKLSKTLKNVKGKLLDNFQEQWMTLAGKVRNNYRKAVKNNLRIKFFEHKDIGDAEVAEFYRIYVSTMIRNNAQKFLYFSAAYFENLVLNNRDKFSVAFVYKDGKAISTELIIEHGDMIHAFLGGTIADYFEYRPNDFLRVEVIKWAIENGKKFYVLGGGIKDGDGLYRSKKSLFPKNEDVIFYTGQKVIDQKMYRHFNQKLVPLADSENTSYFPLYRSPD